jgi:hypothetical protein
MPEHVEEEHQSHLSRKCTLVKSRVGVVKKSCYDLPQSADHVYGCKNPNQDVGVSDLISSWVTSNPSTGKESSKLIVFSNILAIKNGCVTARAMRKYAAEHPNIRRKEALQSNSSGRVDTRFEGPFGKKTVSADEKMDMIIQAKYTNFGPEDIDYPDISCIKKTGSFPKPRATNASESIKAARMEREKNKTKKKFCMKRFQNIKGTFTLPLQNVPGIPKPGQSKHQEILVHHHHDLDKGMYHGPDHRPQYAHELPGNLRGADQEQGHGKSC